MIHPTAEPWKYTPEIEVGATVYMGQTLLLMPDLSQMQVKVGIPEAIVHRIQPGLDARITLRGETLDGQVSSVASVTAPTSKWTGNIVTYDTIIKLPSGKGLMPGMSAEVEVIIARYNDVLTIPVAAVVGTTEDKILLGQDGRGTATAFAGTRRYERRVHGRQGRCERRRRSLPQSAGLRANRNRGSRNRSTRQNPRSRCQLGPALSRSCKSQVPTRRETTLREMR